MSKKRKQSTNKATKGVSDRTIALLLGLFAFILYVNTLGHEYVLDDDLAITVHTNVQRGLAGIFDIFRQPYREQCLGGCLYRPLTLTTFAVEWAIAPNKPFIGHLMNVLWYSATSILLFFTLRRLLPAYNIILPLVATILFTAHPIHTEVVANIKSRDEILSLFFVILSLHQFAKWNKTNSGKTIIYSALAFFAAMLSKEGAVTAVFIFPLVAWIFFQKPFYNSIKYSIWVVVPVALFFLLRSIALTGLADPEIHMIDNPIVEAQGTERLGTSFAVLAKYIFQLVFPVKLISDYSYNVIPLQALGSINSLIGLVIYSVIIVYAVIGLIRRRMSGFFAAAFIFSISLYSQIPIVIGTLMGERLLYTPSLWFILGVASLVMFHIKTENKTSASSFNWKYFTSAQRNLLMGCAVLALLYSIQTVIRNKDWISDFKLMESDVDKAPNSVRLNDAYAEEMYKSTFDQSLTADEIDQRLKISEEYARKSLAIKPGIISYNNLGNINFTRKNFAEAINYYQKTKEILKDYDMADRNTVYALMVWSREESEKNNNPRHALELLQQALVYDENNADLHHMRGQVHLRLGNNTEALSALEKAYNLAPDNAKIKADLSAIYLSMGMAEKAAALQ